MEQRVQDNEKILFLFEFNLAFYFNWSIFRQANEK